MTMLARLPSITVFARLIRTSRPCFCSWLKIGRPILRSISITACWSAYEAGSRALKRRLLEHARRTGQMEWLRDVSASGNIRWPSDLTDADWELAIQRLAQEQKWPELWRLCQVAPPLWTVQILEYLAGTGWLPPDPEEQSFFAALSSLARECQAAPLALHARKTLIAPHGALNCLAIRPDGAQIAAGSTEQPIFIWDLPDGRLRYPPLSGPAPVVRALAFSSDGSQLATAAGDHRIRIFRLQDGALLKTIDGHRALIRALAMHPDGRLLASAGFDGTIRLWRFPHGTALKTIQPVADGSGAEIFALVTGATAGGSAYLISAGADRLVRVWSLPDGMPLRQMSGHADTITNLSTSPGSDLVASAGRDGVVRVWNFTSGGLVRVLEDAGAPLTALCLHNTDQVLLGAISHPSGSSRPGSNVELLVWNLSTGRIIARHPVGLSTGPGEVTPQQPVTGLAISPSGDDLYSCDSAGRLLVWDLRTFLTARLAADASRPGAAVQLLSRLKTANLTPSERKWLAFSAELARYRQRFDIELAEFETIPIGEFDIEL
jgi:WD40 repeat protein